MKNLLVSALKIIPRSKFQYRLSSETSINEFGQRVHLYGDWNDAYGIVQPGIISSFGGKNISEKDYKDIGLDISRSCITIWIKDIYLRNTADRETSDQVLYGGRVWNVIQCADWDIYNGWRRCFCQEAMNLEGETVP